MKTLFDPIALARNSDPSTSHDAAERVENSGKASCHRNRILRGVKDHPGLTGAELGREINLSQAQVGRRINELRDAGLIRYGEPRMCREVHGQSVTLWAITNDKGAYQ